jgi:hypothetical protein
MREVKLGIEEQLVAPVNAVAVTITHEWGKVETDNSLSDPQGWTPTSIGVHKIVWTDVNGAVISTEFVSVFAPIIDLDMFLSDYPQYSSLTEDDFDRAEKAMRHHIQSFTGHQFGPYIEQEIDVQGDGGYSLELPVPVISLDYVQDAFGTPLTDFVEVSPNIATIIQTKTNFKSTRYFSVKEDVSITDENFFDSANIFTVGGSFGWEYVPVDVSMAAGILLDSGFTGSETAELRSEGAYEIQIGDFRLKLNADQFGTVGNARADLLLSGYVNFGLGLV